MNEFRYYVVGLLSDNLRQAISSVLTVIHTQKRWAMLDHKEFYRWESQPSWDYPFSSSIQMGRIYEHSIT